MTVLIVPPITIQKCLFKECESFWVIFQKVSLPSHLIQYSTHFYQRWLQLQ